MARSDGPTFGQLGTYIALGMLICALWRIIRDPAFQEQRHILWLAFLAVLGCLIVLASLLGWASIRFTKSGQ